MEWYLVDVKLEVEEKKETEAQSCFDLIWYSLSCSASFDLVIILPFRLLRCFLSLNRSNVDSVCASVRVYFCSSPTLASVERRFRRDECAGGNTTAGDRKEFELLREERMGTLLAMFVWVITKFLCLWFSHY